jgi:hypothetical protein
VLGTWPAERRRHVGQREIRAEQSRGPAEEDEDRSMIFQKCRDLTVMSWQLSNYSSNENVPKTKSVEFSKVYNFALRFNRKKAKDLKLT